MRKHNCLLILFFFITQIPIICASAEDVKVNLGFEKTTVNERDGVVVTLSAINLEINPPLNIQLILTVPDDMSITATEFIKSGGRQYTTTYFVKPGDERHINIHLKTHKPGVYYIKGDYYYYFDGIDSTKKHGNISKNINVMPIMPTPSPTPTHTATPDDGNGIPGFGVVFAIAGLLALTYIVKQKK